MCNFVATGPHFQRLMQPCPLGSAPAWISAYAQEYGFKQAEVQAGTASWGCSDATGWPIRGWRVNHAPAGSRRHDDKKCVIRVAQLNILFDPILSSAYRGRMIDEPSVDRLLPVDTIAERWGSAVDAGFTAVPNALVRAQDKLGLSATDLVVLLNIVMHWWHRDRRPTPRSTAIAKRSGIGHRTVQRSLRRLEKLGLIERIRVSRDKTEYRLDGLRDRLAFYANTDGWYRPELISRARSD